MTQITNGRGGGAVNASPVAEIGSKDIARFWSKVEVGGDCWPWLGHAAGGYGQIKIAKRTWIASRVSYTIAHGPIPLGMLVCHHCDNPICVRPDHLFLGTDRDNTDDKIRKGRSHRGSRHPHASLSEADVLEVRRLLKEGWRQRDIGARFKIATSTVAHIATGRTWGWLVAEPTLPDTVPSVAA